MVSADVVSAVESVPTSVGDECVKALWTARREVFLVALLVAGSCRVIATRIATTTDSRSFVVLSAAGAGRVIAARIAATTSVSRSSREAPP